MNIISETPRAVLATSGAVTTATYYAKDALVVGDFVEISEDGNTVFKLVTGKTYAGIVIATASDNQTNAGNAIGSKTVSVLSQGRVELPADPALLAVSAMSFLALKDGKLTPASPGDFACAYLVHGNRNWAGTVVVEFFFPCIPICRNIGEETPPVGTKSTQKSGGKA